MWVCRAGQNAIYLDYFIKTSRIYLAWKGYNEDLRDYKSMSDYRPLVAREKNIDNRTSISNWAGQLYSFCHEMKVGEYVLIPLKSSHEFILAQICSDYSYSVEDAEDFHHSREIKVIRKNIPRNIFPLAMQRSLNAYRTLFKAKEEEKILQIINEWNG